MRTFKNFPSSCFLFFFPSDKDGFCLQGKTPSILYCSVTSAARRLGWGKGEGRGTQVLLSGETDRLGLAGSEVTENASAFLALEYSV